MKTELDNTGRSRRAQSNAVRLIVLTMVHFIIDFYGGVTVPIIEPTLTTHLGVGLGTVALLVGGCALLINAIQPVSQWILPKTGAPRLLIIAPLMAACVALIGISSHFWVVTAMFLISSVGIGIIHPEAALAAHSLAGRSKGLGLSLFMSGGYFGFSLGSLSSGLWTEFRDQGLAHFWLLALPALGVTALVVWTRLYRIKGHLAEAAPVPGTPTIPFPLVMGLALCITTTVVLLARMLPIFLVRSFPQANAQGWAGTTVSVIGISGVAGMFLWGHLADRFGSGKVIAGVIPCGLPFLWLLFHIESIGMAPVWGACVGVTIGALFPLCVVLARHARGLPQRLRMGLVIGGAWGSGELIFMLAGKYVGRFPTGVVRPVASVLNLTWGLAIAATLIALVIARLPKRDATTP